MDVRRRPRALAGERRAADDRFRCRGSRGDPEGSRDEGGPSFGRGSVWAGPGSRRHLCSRGGACSGRPRRRIDSRGGSRALLAVAGAHECKRQLAPGPCPTGIRRSSGGTTGGGQPGRHRRCGPRHWVGPLGRAPRLRARGGRVTSVEPKTTRYVLGPAYELFHCGRHGLTEKACPCPRPRATGNLTVTAVDRERAVASEGVVSSAPHAWVLAIRPRYSRAVKMTAYSRLDSVLSLA